MYKLKFKKLEADYLFTVVLHKKQETQRKRYSSLLCNANYNGTNERTNSVLTYYLMPF